MKVSQHVALLLNLGLLKDCLLALGGAIAPPPPPLLASYGPACRPSFVGQTQDSWPQLAINYSQRLYDRQRVRQLLHDGQPETIFH